MLTSSFGMENVRELLEIQEFASFRKNDVI